MSRISSSPMPRVVRGRATNAELPLGLHWRIDVVRDGVLVHGDARFVQGVFGFAAQNAAGENIHQHYVGVGAA